jgi:hypothetical protein
MNPADQRFNDRLFKRISNLEKQLQDIKTAQRMGLDNFEYDITDIISSSVYLNSGQDHILIFNFNADTPKYYTSELTMSFFINNNLDDAYHWPDGSALADPSGLRPLEIVPIYDIWDSDETGVGRKRYYVHITNYSAFAKTVHWHVGLVFPKGGVT